MASRKDDQWRIGDRERDTWGRPEDWSNQEWNIYKSLGPRDVTMLKDPYLQDLMERSMFDFSKGKDKRQEAYFEIQSYLFTEYDLVFTDELDWEAYQEWYTTTSQ